MIQVKQTVLLVSVSISNKRENKTTSYPVSFISNKAEVLKPDSPLQSCGLFKNIQRDARAPPPRDSDFVGLG